MAEFYNYDREFNMSITVEELEREVTQLPQNKLKQFRDWFENFDSNQWDNQIEVDVNGGKLDSIAELAIADHNAGKSKKL